MCYNQFSADRQPFNIRFLTDTYEFLGEAAGPDIGARLVYIQEAC